MGIASIQELIEAGVHFGHRSSRWHPAMEPYIHQKHNRIHIVDLRETVKGLLRAQHFLTHLVEAGHECIFVGTKAQAKEIVEAQAQRCGMHWVTHRWLGGTLTNFHTIRSRLRRLEELERVEADGSSAMRSKKEISSIRRERRKIQRNLEGVRKMNRLPGAIILADVRRDEIAVNEARSLGIPVVAIVDTDCDPRTADLVVPGNDDAFRSIEILLQHFADAVIAGRDKLVIRQAEEEKKRQEEEAEARRKAAERAAVEAMEKAQKAKAAEVAAAAAAAAAAVKPVAGKPVVGKLTVQKPLPEQAKPAAEKKAAAEAPAETPGS